MVEKDTEKTAEEMEKKEAKEAPEKKSREKTGKSPGIKFWEDVKQGASNLFTTTKHGLGKFGTEVGKKGKISKLKLDISSIERRIQQDFTRLGTRVYELVEDKKGGSIPNDEEFKDIISEINDYKKDIAKTEKEIEKVEEIEYKKDKKGADVKKKSPKTATAKKKPAAKKPAEQKTEVKKPEEPQEEKATEEND